ncbi:TolC family outer membrane protein [Edwardsiella anguillarum]|nr:TolC family outer membrane protein [Edwardsiella anguillarum]
MSQEELSANTSLRLSNNSRIQDVVSPVALDITKAVWRAVQWHPSIAEVASKIYESSERVNIERAKYYPRVSLGMNNELLNSSSGFNYDPAIDLSLTQVLYDFGKIDSSLRAAKAKVAQTQAELLLRVDTVAYDTAKSVVQIQGYQKLIDIARDQVIALESIMMLAQQRYREGASSFSDVVQTQTRIEGARSTLLQYQANLERWQATLANFLGWGHVNSVADELPWALSNYCQIASLDYKIVPAALLSTAQLRYAQANLDTAMAQMTPTIALVPNVTHYIKDSGMVSRGYDRTQFALRVKVDMPLYQGGGLSANRNAAQYMIQSARAALKNTELNISRQLNESKNEEITLSRTLITLSKQKKLAEETFRLYKKQYLQLGGRTLLDLLNAEQEIYQVSFSEIEINNQLNILQLDCLYSTGNIRSAFKLNNTIIQSVEVQS